MPRRLRQPPQPGERESAAAPGASASARPRRIRGWPGWTRSATSCWRSSARAHGAARGGPLAGADGGGAAEELPRAGPARARAARPVHARGRAPAGGRARAAGRARGGGEGRGGEGAARLGAGGAGRAAAAAGGAGHVGLAPGGRAHAALLHAGEPLHAGPPGAHGGLGLRGRGGRGPAPERGAARCGDGRGDGGAGGRPPRPRHAGARR